MGARGRFRPVVGLTMITAVVFGMLMVRAVPDRAGAAPAPLAFGAFTQPTGGQTLQQAVTQFEQQIERPLAVVRVFETWARPFPTSYHTWLRSTGHTLILSVKPTGPDGRIPWTSISAAQPGDPIDTQIRSWAQRIKAFDAPIYVTFNHEPESSSASTGTAAEFVAAWRKWVSVFREEGATNVRHMWIMTDYAFHVGQSDRRYGPNWYPGDEWVDAMAIDAYNWHVCRPNQDNVWKTLATIIEPFRRFGLQHPSEEMWLTEWASWEDPQVANRKAGWIDEARELFDDPGYEQFRGVVYFHSNAINRSFVDCNWRVTTSASALQAFATMAADPRYGAPGFPPAPTTTTTTTTTLVPEVTTTLVPEITTTTTAPPDSTTTTTTAPPDTTTSTTTPPTSSISFVGQATSNANSTIHRVTIPAGVQPGDALVLASTLNTNATVSAPSGVTGWTSHGTRTNASIGSRVWSRVAAPGDAGRTITLTASRTSKGSLVLLVYRGTSATSPVAAAPSALETVSRAAHTTPSAAVTDAGSWIVSYWAHEDSSTTALAGPSALTTRATGTQSGSGRITVLAADTGAAASSAPGRTANASAANVNAAMWTVVLRPA